ncbi:hypothetical protein AK812_SmicGene35684 [Symbiodinium microadriaticum]|uniref:C2H2-type domain-containing protein n=1 Tax=Symbiodinium microadriaticum TaxID=2951 RepID=A0A1Q9CKW2_SYMMI|nr:hypothetical protein AK812_SmicGene35684 [Symbiodinium microadriaticum]
MNWVQKILTLFADDFCGHWTITNLQDWKAVISDLTLLLETLATYNLKVNLQKTALLINLKGRSAKKVLRQHTRHKAGDTFLVLVVHGKECLLKIKESHTYLGTIISYRNRRDLNIGHRISSAQTRYQQLRKILNGRGPLSIKYRLRLWQACIPPSLTYSLEATGCTSKGLQRLKIVATRHLRAILREPAHLHHVKTSAIWERAKLPTPEQSILARMTKFRANRNPAHTPHGPDLIMNTQVVEQISSLIAGMQEAMQPLEHLDLTPPEEAQPTPNTGFACAHCDHVLPTAHARLIHYAIKHPEAMNTEAPRPQTIFHAPDHAINGLPTCKLCHRNFTKWQQLKLHIEKGIRCQSQQPQLTHSMGDLETEIFEHCMPSGAAEAGTEHANKRARPDIRQANGRRGRPPYHAPLGQSPWRQQSGYQTPAQDSQIRLLSKIVLKHEEQLAALRKDTQFVLFFRQDDKSILPSLMNVSREWKAKQAAGDQSIQSSQRTVLISCLLRELLARIQRVVATEPGRESLKKAEWLTGSNAWTYMRWSPKLRKLVADVSKEPLVHDEAVRIISELQKSMRGEIIHRFQSTINLAKLEEQGAQQAIFHLGVSLRGSEATEVYEQFRKLAGLSLTSLAGFSMKVDDQQRPPMAQHLAQMTYGGGHFNVLSRGAQSHVLDDAKTKEPATNAFLDQVSLKLEASAMSDESGMNHFLLRKYGDTWTAAHLSLMEYQLKELEAQMMLMQRHVDNMQSQMHSLQLLVHRHAYLYSNRVTNKAMNNNRQKIRFEVSPSEVRLQQRIAANATAQTTMARRFVERLIISNQELVLKRAITAWQSQRQQAMLTSAAVDSMTNVQKEAAMELAFLGWKTQTAKEQASLSRGRFRLDVAYMLQRQGFWMSMLGCATETEDLFLVQETSLAYAEAVKQLELTRRICDPLRYVFLDEADTALEDEGDDDVSEQILGAMDVRLLPIVTLGVEKGLADVAAVDMDAWLKEEAEALVVVPENADTVDPLRVEVLKAELAVAQDMACAAQQKFGVDTGDGDEEPCKLRRKRPMGSEDGKPLDGLKSKNSMEELAESAEAGSEEEPEEHDEEPEEHDDESMAKDEDEKGQKRATKDKKEKKGKKEKTKHTKNGKNKKEKKDKKEKKESKPSKPKANPAKLKKSKAETEDDPKGPKATPKVKAKKLRLQKLCQSRTEAAAAAEASTAKRPTTLTELFGKAKVDE